MERAVINLAGRHQIQFATHAEQQKGGEKFSWDKTFFVLIFYLLSASGSGLLFPEERKKYPIPDRRHLQQPTIYHVVPVGSPGLLLPSPPKETGPKEKGEIVRNLLGAYSSTLSSPSPTPPSAALLSSSCLASSPSAAPGAVTYPGCEASRRLRGGTTSTLGLLLDPPLLRAGVSLREVCATAVLALGRPGREWVISLNPAFLNWVPVVGHRMALLAEGAPRGSSGASGASMAPPASPAAIDIPYHKNSD